MLRTGFLSMPKLAGLGFRVWFLHGLLSRPHACENRALGLGKKARMSHLNGSFGGPGLKQTLSTHLASNVASHMLRTFAGMPGVGV